MTLVFLSPHLDDAVLSCGGTIARLAAAGQAPLVLTVFAGFAKFPLSPLGERLHREWGDPPDAVQLRRAEDVAAAARLGAQVRHLSLPEALYRQAGQGWRYAEEGSIFGPRHPLDEVLPAQVARAIVGATDPRDTLIAPLGIGMHVDHVLVRDAAVWLRARARDVRFYEDLPYVANPARYGTRGPDLTGWSAHVEPLDGEHLRAKLSALGYYRSQIPVLFETEAAMADLVSGHASRVGAEVGAPFAERQWRPAARTAC